MLSEDNLYKVLAMFDPEDAKQVNLKQFEVISSEINDCKTERSEEKKLIKKRDEAWNRQ